MNTRLLAAAAIFALAAPAALAPAAFGQAKSNDTGSMAYPAPLPQGNIGTTNTVPRTNADSGSMAFPAPVPQGNIGSTAGTTAGGRPADTGSMAFPAPVPQGNVGTTITK